jgi:hypothetical protein
VTLWPLDPHPYELLGRVVLDALTDRGHWIVIKLEGDVIRCWERVLSMRKGSAGPAGRLDMPAPRFSAASHVSAI